MSKFQNGNGDSSAPSKIVAIRKGIRVRKSNRPEDEPLVAFRAKMQSSLAEVKASQCVGADQELYFSEMKFALAVALRPTSKLRCIHSTLDERMDFQLRCAEAKLLKAEHELIAAKHEQQRLLAGDVWWGSENQHRMISERHKLWEKYRDSIQIVATTPARTEQHLKQKRELIGRMWLGADGEWYDRLRSAIAADTEWLQENGEPSRRRRKH